MREFMGPVLLTALLLAAPPAALAQPDVATVFYASAAHSVSGYENASVRVRYDLLNCSGVITIAVERVPGSVSASPRYWYEGAQVTPTVPPPESPHVPFRGSVLHGGTVVGRFQMEASDALSMGCYNGDTQTVAKLSDHLGPDATSQQRADFMKGLSLDVDIADETLKNFPAEQAIRTALGAAKREEEAQQKERERLQQEQEEKARLAGAGKPAATVPKDGTTSRAPTVRDYEDGNYWGTGTPAVAATTEDDPPIAAPPAGVPARDPGVVAMERLVAEQRRVDQNVEHMSAVVDRSVGGLSQTFSGARGVKSAAGNIEALSNMDGVYASVAEIEAEYSRRITEMQQEFRSMEASQAEVIQGQTAMYFGDSETDAAVGEVIGTLGSMYATAQREKEERLAKERLETQRQEMVRQFEVKRLAAMAGMRKSLIAEFPDGTVPLSSQRVDADVLYFFSYTVDPATIERAHPAITVTNVFPLARNGDGTWPFKHVLTGEIRQIVPGSNTLVGFDTSRPTLETMRETFVKVAGQSGFVVQAATYIGRPPKEVSADSPSDRAVAGEPDFWGPAIGSTSTGSRSQPEGGELDFWDQPTATEGADR